MQDKSYEKYHPLEETNMSFEDVKKLVDNLSDEDKRKLAQHLIGGNKSPLNVILGGYNVINNSVSLQLNGDVETVAEQLKNCDPQTIQLLLDAIALVINSPK